MKASSFALLTLNVSLVKEISVPTCLAFTPTQFNTGYRSTFSRSAPQTSSTQLFSLSAPDDRAIQEAYAQWRLKFSKGEFNAERYQNFKSNFVAVTAHNNMEHAKAKKMGGAAPAPIQLNQYGDCSADEYNRLMKGNQNTVSNNIQPNNSNIISKALQPSTPIPVASSSTTPTPSSQGGSLGRQQEMANNASSNLRAAMQQRSGLESEVEQIQAALAEKQRLLQEAKAETEFYMERIALRDEQKRILNDRLNNGWDDEK